MADKLAAVCQVSDMLVERLEGWDDLDGFTIVNEVSSEEAVPACDGNVIRVTFAVHPIRIPEEQWKHLHLPIYDLAVEVRDDGGAATRNRATMNAIAHIVAAVAADPSFGGVLQDFCPVDVASTEANGRDVNASSIQFRAEFYTESSDWFTIVPG